MAVRTRITPPMNSKGLFEIDKPFTLVPKRVYEVIAIRELADLLILHQDVYKLYYEPYGISEEQYREDARQNVAIVSLRGQDGVHYVPDTYILSYPELGMADYYRSVLSVDLGAVHKQVNLDGLKKQIAQLCSEFLGVEATVHAHTAPVTDSITLAEARALEKTRTGLIQIPETDYLKYKQAIAEKEALVKRTNALIEQAQTGNRTNGTHR